VAEGTHADHLGPVRFGWYTLGSAIMALSKRVDDHSVWSWVLLVTSVLLGTYAAVKDLRDRAAAKRAKRIIAQVQKRKSEPRERFGL
jgi:hypothetical protein